MDEVQTTEQVVSNTLLSMEDIAKCNTTLSENTITNTRNQLRMFLVAQAQRELTRVVKLTEMLDKLQTQYIAKAEEYMQNHDDANSSVLYLPSMIDTISKCLDTSNKIISQVLGNDKIMNFQIVDNSTNITNVGDSAVSGRTGIQIDLEDPASRLKVRETVNAILAMMEKEESNKEVVVEQAEEVTVEPEESNK